jgi:hypothetical protein
MRCLTLTTSKHDSEISANFASRTLEQQNERARGYDRLSVQLLSWSTALLAFFFKFSSALPANHLSLTLAVIFTGLLAAAISLSMWSLL